MMPKLPDLDGKIAGYLPDFVVGGEGLPAIWNVDVQRLLIAYGRAVAEACAVIADKYESAYAAAKAIREAAKEIK